MERCWNRPLLPKASPHCARRALPNLVLVQHCSNILIQASPQVSHLSNGLTTFWSPPPPHTLDRASVLIVDQYPAHLADGVRQHLANHNITILEVPARGTSLLQPLDVGVFGVAKKKINANYKEDMFLKDWTEPDRWESTTECVRALGRVHQLSIMRGWQLAFPNYIFELKKRDMAYWTEKKPKRL